MEKSKLKRVPRLRGSSVLLDNYYKTPTRDNLEKLQRYYIQAWVVSGGYLLNKSYSLIQLSTFLNVPIDYIQSLLQEQMSNHSMWQNGSNVEDMLAKMISTQIAWAYEDRFEIDAQVQLLKRSQDGKFQPFISSEVNKSLDLKQKSVDNLTKVIKNVIGSGGPQVQIFNTHQENTQINNVTLEQVMEIVSMDNSKASRDAPVQFLENNYDILGLPNVQAGVSAIKDNAASLENQRKALQIVVDTYQTNIDDDHHQVRRELELGVDVEEIDPEIVDY